MKNWAVSIAAACAIALFVAGRCSAPKPSANAQLCAPFVESALAQANAEALERAQRQAQKAFDAGAEVVADYEKKIMEVNIDAQKVIYSSNDGGVIDERVCNAMCDAYAAIHTMRAAADCGVPGADGTK